METNQNPFSLYDFLGYLIPGAIFLTGMHIIPRTCYFNMCYFKSFTCAFNQIESGNWIQIVLFVIFSYFSGHFLSYLSSMTIEKYSIWTIGYPSKYMFDNLISDSKRKQRRVCYLYIVCYFCPPKDRKRGHLYKFWVLMIRLMLLIILLPVTLPLLILVSILKLNGAIQKPLDKELAEIIIDKSEKKLNNLTGKTHIIMKEDGDSFRILYHYAIEHYKVHRYKMQNYVALYGFCRTVSLIMVLLFWWFLYHHHLSFTKDFFLQIEGLGLLSFLSFVFYLAFNKFFRKFTLECMMAITSNEEKKIPENSLIVN